MLNELIEFRPSDAEGTFLRNAGMTIELARNYAYLQVSKAQAVMGYLIGYWLVELQQAGNCRAPYGKALLKTLSQNMTAQYGRGFSVDTLENMRKFYLSYHDRISETAFRIFVKEKNETAFRNLVKDADFLVPWSHYLKLMQVQDSQTRLWYERETASEGWDVRTLQRNISTQYFERLLLAENRKPVTDEMHALTANFQRDAKRFVKNPYILEFLNLPEDPASNESLLESALITNIGRFLMELGRGYAFVARQQHIRTKKEDYYIDLVFYNYVLKCFVLIDLKIGKITYQDVGQMDMYVQMYDERKKAPDDNPTLGIILCSDTDEDVARYSGLHGNEQLFASKYKLVLPTDQQLRAEIETQKEIFYMQHPELKEE
ncbi:MAG: DUF1016 family protein [Victivallales bacterium]|nr:DUF1016 family protein [Victivallales bacterium]